MFEDLIASIDGRLLEIDREIASLRSGRAALTATSEPVRSQNGSVRQKKPVAKEPARTPRKPVAKRPARTPRKSDAVPAGRLVAILSEHEGLSTGALATIARGDRARILPLLRELEAQGEIRRTGQRRGTLWHIVTDEDRVARRAAELEAARRS